MEDEKIDLILAGLILAGLVLARSEDPKLEIEHTLRAGSNWRAAKLRWCRIAIRSSHR